MTNDEHSPTVPRTPAPPTDATEDTKPRLLDESAIDPNATTDQIAREPAATKTVTRAPSDVARLEEGVRATLAEGVPGYAILGKLGEGGMGVVHKARHLKLNRVVALKMMLGDEATSRNDLIRFLAEAEAVAAIKHENVVQVFDFGEADNRPFMALEFCAGGALTKHLPKTPTAAQAPREMAALIAKVARGVAAAHALGIIHRDLKPANVFLDEAGVPKVADFGLAKRGEGADVTQSGTGMGTPAYMAPEQAKDAKFVGPQADVWALGVMLYESLTGTRPFTGTVQEIMAKAQNAEPTAPRKAVAVVPLDLELICLKCLSKAPHERYPTAKELADDLDRFLRGEAISVRPLGAAERIVRWVRRKPTLAALYGFSALAVALALVVFFVFGLYREAERAKKDAIGARDTAEGAKKVAEGAKKDAEGARDQLAGEKKLTEQARDDEKTQRGIAEKARDDAKLLQGKAEQAEQRETALRKIIEVSDYGRTVQVARQELRENNVLAARATLDGIDPKLRGWEWYYVRRNCDTSLSTLKSPRGNGGLACFSPDGSRILTKDDSNVAKVWDAKTGAELVTLKGAALESVCSIAFSADGSQIVLGTNDHSATVWDAKKGVKTLTLKGHSAHVSSACFSPDGTRIATASYDQTAKIWDAKTGAELFALKRPFAGTTDAVCFSPDSSRVVTAHEDRTVRIWDAKTGAELFALKESARPVHSANFSADGGRIVTSCSDGTATIWDAKTGAELLVLRGHTNEVRSAYFNADGSRVVTASIDKSAKVWHAHAGTELATLRGHTESVHSACFNADGSQIITGSADGTAKVWDARNDPEVFTLKANLTTPHFTADGSRIGGGVGNIAMVWDAKTRVELLTLNGHTATVVSLHFSADDSRIVTGSHDKTAKVWNAKTGTELLTLKGHADLVHTARFSADGSRIVTGSSDNTAKVWDAKTGAELLTLKGHENQIHSASFSPDGSLVVTGSSDKTAKIWDAKAGAEVRELNGHVGAVFSVCFSADGTRVVTGSHDKTAKIWDVKTGDEILTLKAHSIVEVVCFSADDARVVTGSREGVVKMWDTKTGAELLTLKAHNNVSSVFFSKDGSQMFTAGHDRTAKIWDAGPSYLASLPKELAPPPRAVNR